MGFHTNGSVWVPNKPGTPRHPPDWNWNKRNYYGQYPPKNIAYPPTGGGPPRLLLMRSTMSVVVTRTSVR
eukprot:gene27119-50669_t